MLNVYDMNTKKEAGRWPNNNIKNLFGLIRYGRAQGTELGLLMNEIPDTNWRKCQKGSLQCLYTENSQLTIKNTTPEPTLCGDLGIAKEKPVPWAFGDEYGKINMPSIVVRVKVQCGTS